MHNQTAAPYPDTSTLEELIASQVASNPTSCAVACGPRTLSYQELDQAANRMARLLVRRNLAPGTRIAVLLERSTDLVVTLLAILKAGSAYIPLDPAYPTERLSHVLDDAKPAAIVSSSAIMRRFAHGDIVAFLLDEEREAIETESAAAAKSSATPEDVAYTIYTSGSTGIPKGVEIQHRSVVNFLWAMRRQPGLADTDTLLAVTTISFDIAVLEIFLPLIVGAKVVLAEEKDLNDGAALEQLLRVHAATVLQATPATWQLLIAAGWQSAPGQKMLCGGEALTRKLARLLLAGGGELWNMYGPTETTVWSSVLRVTEGIGPVPLGPPIANTQFYVLDEHGELVAPGDTGELFIGGAGVALGYLGLRELTAERFSPDRFRDSPHARLYRTGDIVRVPEPGRTNYSLEYLGRTDQQVKLRGFRIELGEIEATLLRHPDITEAIAIVGESPLRGPAIWAYVVRRSASASPLSNELLAELRLNLERFLPTYMHPAHIVGLAELPRTPNGKTDRRALCPPEETVAAQPALDEQESSSRKDLETRLSAIWGAVLGRRRFEVTENFFSLGGHSLLAAHLLVRIEAEFGVRLTLAALFGAPTIAEQASLVQRQGERHYDFRQTVKLQTAGSRAPLIAIHNTGVFYYNLSRLLGPDQPLTALQVFDPATPRSSLPTSLEAIAAEYVELIRRVQPSGPYQLIGWCVGGVLAFEIARQLGEQYQTVSFVALIDAWAPGNLRRLSKPRAWLAEHSYRAQLILTDWRRTLSGRQSLVAFLSRRTLVQRLLRTLGSARPGPRPATFEDRNLSDEHYDHWLDRYLDEASSRYTPQPYKAKVLLLRSSQEPRGWFLDPLLGWGAFVPAGTEPAVVDGDHFTVFQGGGLEQMARIITSSLAAPSLSAQPRVAIQEQEACSGSAVAASSAPPARDDGSEHHAGIARDAIGPRDFRVGLTAGTQHGK